MTQRSDTHNIFDRHIEFTGVPQTEKDHDRGYFNLPDIPTLEIHTTER